MDYDYDSQQVHLRQSNVQNLTKSLDQMTVYDDDNNSNNDAIYLSSKQQTLGVLEWWLRILPDYMLMVI